MGIIMSDAPIDSMIGGADRFEKPQHKGEADRWAAVLVDSGLEVNLLYLVHWPEFDRIDTSSMSLVARICALLSRKPTVGFLIAPILGVAPAQVTPILEQFQAQGLLAAYAPQAEPIENTKEVREESRPAPVEKNSTATPSSEEKESTFIARLWRRLTRQV